VTIVSIGFLIVLAGIIAAVFLVIALLRRR
jgi:hypothetical protein